MKNKHIYFFLSVIFLTTLISCKKDFLDLTPNTYLNGATYFKNEAEVLSAVNGMYAFYQSQLDIYMHMAEMRSDNTTNQYNPNLRANPSTHREELDEFRDNAANDYTNYWNFAYGALYRANTVLLRISDVAFANTALKDRLVGEALFTRAFYYFNLVRFYGDVPLIIDPVTDVSSAFGIGRTSAAEVYAQIESDISQASVFLPVAYSGSDVGRITKGAALTLLAKVQMTQDKFAAAIETLRQITSLGYSLQPSYQDCFRPGNKNNSESIFEIQFSSSIPGESNNVMLSWVPYGTDAWKAILGYFGGNEYGVNIPTRDMMQSYENGDLRQPVSVKSGYIGPTGDSVRIPFVAKWLYVDPVPNRNDCNFPVYRYADVLLMLAECINEVSGPTGEAVNLLNEVRARAGLSAKMPGTKEIFAADLEHERRVELAFEGHRWFDLLRTGRAVEVMTAHGAAEKANPSTPRGPGEQYLPGAFVIEPYRLLYPVPQSEINKNPKVLIQNPNY